MILIFARDPRSSTRILSWPSVRGRLWELEKSKTSWTLPCALPKPRSIPRRSSKSPWVPLHSRMSCFSQRRLWIDLSILGGCGSICHFRGEQELSNVRISVAPAVSSLRRHHHQMRLVRWSSFALFRCSSRLEALYVGRLQSQQQLNSQLSVRFPVADIISSTIGQVVSSPNPTTFGPKNIISATTLPMAIHNDDVIISFWEMILVRKSTHSTFLKWIFERYGISSSFHSVSWECGIDCTHDETSFLHSIFLLSLLGFFRSLSVLWHERSTQMASIQSRLKEHGSLHTSRFVFLVTRTKFKPIGIADTFWVHKFS